MTENNDIKSIYKLGAEDGALLGVFLVTMFFCNIYSTVTPLLGLLGMAMFIGVPFIVYFMVYRGYKANARYRFFSASWMHGIMIFLCASLILGLAIYVYLRFVNPTYLPDTFSQFAEILSADSDPKLKEWADNMALLAQSGQPSPIVFAFSTIWCTAFSGSVLSMFIALLVKLVPKRYDNDGSQWQ